MTLYHPRALADKLEGLVPELQRWSHRARMALDNAQVQEKRIEDRHSQSSHRAQMHEHQLVLDQECVQQADALLQVYAENCQEALANAQQTARTAQSILNETQTTYNRMQQALQSAQEALAQAEQALGQATANLGSKMAEFAQANARGVQDAKRAANYSLSMAQEAQSRANSTVQAASARVTSCTKAVALASQALELARVAHQRAQAGLKASEDSIGFVRAASRALVLGKQALGQEKAAIEATLAELQNAMLITQEASTQLVVARSHEQLAQRHSADTLRILQIKIDLLIFMNQPELDGISGTMVASLQLAATLDRGASLQPPSHRLERLRAKLENVYGLKPSQWRTMNQDERAEVLQNAHNAMAIVYRFDPVVVEIAALPPNTLGSFSRVEETIKISKRLVMSSNHIETLKTLIHESRHAYQWHLAQHLRRGFGWHSDADWTLAQEWSDNFADYKSASQSGSRAYSNQPVEADAYSFEETVIKLLF
jgi:hypothetical protein